MAKKPMNKKLMTFLISIPAIFIVLTVYSGRQPFIISQAYYDTLTYGVFPLSTLVLFAFISLKRYKSTGKTGLQMRLQPIKSTWGKVKAVIQMIVSIPALLALMVWSLYDSIVWPLKLNIGQPITLETQLLDQTPLRRSMKGMTKLTIQSEQVGTTKIFRWPTPYAQQWQEGDTLIISGNQTWFGIVVQSVNQKRA